jgi:hypothetical protein
MALGEKMLFGILAFTEDLLLITPKNGISKSSISSRLRNRRSNLSARRHKDIASSPPRNNDNTVLKIILGLDGLTGGVAGFRIAMSV